MSKRVVFCGDYHAGHKIGLVPPEYQYLPKWKDVQKEMWDFYAETLAELKPIDILVVNGDAIDGRGEKSGGTELITPDRHEQCDIAVRCIAEAEADKVIMTYGTAYHTGQLEDFENQIAKDVAAEKIDSQVWIDVEGVVFHCKHKVGSSSIPHGRHTPIAREWLWNLIWNEMSDHPKADVFIRSHVHYYDFSGNKKHLGLILPALQGLGSKFGERVCSGTVDYGFVHFDCENGGYSWKPHIKDIVLSRPTVVKV